MDEGTKAFFRKQQQDRANQKCIDDGSPNPQWASVSHGCYISLESSGVHRSLGVHVSFVRSITMDSWKPLQLKLMDLGGNQKLKAPEEGAQYNSKEPAGLAHWRSASGPRRR